MKKLLIIDDDVGDQKALERAIKKSDLKCHTHTRSDVASALVLLDELPIDCILLDYRLPDIAGLEGLGKIRNVAPFTPVILVTGVGDELLAREALSHGAADYIPKRNITPIEVAQSVRNAIKVFQMQKALDEQRESLMLFADVLAHDLKSPSRQLSLISEMLVKAVDSNDMDKARKLQGMISSVAGDMNRLIDTLHSYNKAASAKITPQELPLSGVIDSVLLNLNGEIEKSGAEIAITNSDVTILGDRSQLIQLFQNLIGNSIKFCQQERPRIAISASQTEDTTIVSVCDNGIGISAEERDTIFQPFNRLAPASKFDGTGLGLAICKKIVDRHYGRIQLRPSNETGACFDVVLPKTPHAL